MLNIRTFTLSIVMVTVFVFTIALANVRTENVSHAANNLASASEIKERPANLSETNKVTSYRSQFGECFDVPIKDLAACRSASQAAVQMQNSALDECFDVSLSEAANCRKANEEPVP